MTATATPEAPPIIGERPAPQCRLGAILPIGFLVLLCLVEYATLLLPGPWDRQYVAAGDFSQQFYAFQSYAAQRLGQGQLPLWDPYILGGQAHLADPQTALFYPVGLLINLLAGHNGLPYQALEWRAALDSLLGAWFSYLFIAHLSRSRAGGLVGAIAFSLGGYLTSYPLPQLPVLEASIWLPLALYLLERGLTSRRPGRATAWFALAGVAGALLLLAGHDQTAMLAAYAITAYALVRWIALRRSLFLTAGQLVLSALIAAGLGAPQWLPALAYLPVTNRVSLSYAAASGGYAWRDFGQLLLPGGYFLRSDYVGVLPLLLAGIALRRPANWGWPALWLAAALLALGRNGPLYPLLYGHVPGFASFEDQERASYLVAFAEATLAGLGAAIVLAWLRPGSAPAREQAGYRDEADSKPSGSGVLGRERMGTSMPGPLEGDFVNVARSFTGGRVGLVQMFGTGAFIAALSLALTLVGAALLREYAPPASDPAMAAPFDVNVLAAALLAAAALLIVGGVRFRLVRPRLAAALFCLLPAINLLGANGSLGRTATNPVPSLPVHAAALLHAQPGIWRVDTLRDGELPRNVGALLDLSFPRGNDPLVIRRSATLAGQANRYKVWQLFNVQFVLSRQDPGSGFSRIARLDGFNVFRMLYPLPRAWAVRDIEVVKSPAQALAATMALAQPGTMAVLEQPSPLPLAGPTPRSPQVNWLVSSPEDLRLTVSLADASLLVISQPFAPGWRATLDGRPAALLPADYAFVALAVPAGTHGVALRYVPAGLVPGALAAALASVLLAAALLIPSLVGRRDRHA